MDQWIAFVQARLAVERALRESMTPIRKLNRSMRGDTREQRAMVAGWLRAERARRRSGALNPQWHPEIARLLERVMGPA